MSREVVEPGFVQSFRSLLKNLLKKSDAEIIQSWSVCLKIERVTCLL